MKYINFATTLIDQIPEDAVRINDALSVKELTVEGENPDLVLWFLKTGKDGMAYSFGIVLPEAYTSLSTICNEILLSLFTGEFECADDGYGIDIPANDYSDVVRAVSIAAGKVAETERETPRPDPNKIYIQMVSGQVMTSDIGSINWDYNIKNLPGITKTLDNIRQMMHDICSEDPIDDKYNEVADKIRKEIQEFQKTNNMHPDYTKFKSLTDRESILVQLVDVMTLYYEIIMITNTIAAQRQITQEYEAMLHEKDSDVEQEAPSDVEEECCSHSTESSREKCDHKCGSQTCQCGHNCNTQSCQCCGDDSVDEENKEGF